ncbi:MAG: ATP-binding protein [Acidimicrobiales bacterium]
MTTAQLGAAYPFASARPLPADRVLVGRDLAGGPFVHDPFSLYAASVLTNPNMTVVGQIGRGKSALVKSYLFRQAAFGRQVAVLDPKGEYGALAAALGTEPICLCPGGAVQMNPLDAAITGGVPEATTVAGRAALDTGGDTRHRRLGLLRALVEATLRRHMKPCEHLALEVALDSASAAASRLGQRAPTLNLVVDLLLGPEEAAARASGMRRVTLEDDGRDVGLELRRLVRGELAGMFDGDTNEALSPRPGGATVKGPGPSTGASPGPLIVDLSAVYHSEALPALMVCAASWLQAMTSIEGSFTLFVVDEAWSILSDASVGRYLRSSWKLSRAKGLANIAVCHRISDLSSAGSAGSEQSRLAEGLLADSETVVCYAQPPSELPALSAALGCSMEELSVLPRLPRGIALWRVAGRSFLVEHLLGDDERQMVDTDHRLRPRDDGPALE